MALMQRQLELRKYDSGSSSGDSDSDSESNSDSEWYSESEYEPLPHPSTYLPENMQDNEAYQVDILIHTPHSHFTSRMVRSARRVVYPHTSSERAVVHTRGQNSLVRFEMGELHMPLVEELVQAMHLPGPVHVETRLFDRNSADYKVRFSTDEAFDSLLHVVALAREEDRTYMPQRTSRRGRRIRPSQRIRDRQAEYGPQFEDRPLPVPRRRQRATRNLRSSLANS